MNAAIGISSFFNSPNLIVLPQTIENILIDEWNWCHKAGGCCNFWHLFHPVAKQALTNQTKKVQSYYFDPSIQSWNHYRANVWFDRFGFRPASPSLIIRLNPTFYYTQYFNQRAENHGQSWKFDCFIFFVYFFWRKSHSAGAVSRMNIFRLHSRERIISNLPMSKFGFDFSVRRVRT